MFKAVHGTGFGIQKGFLAIVLSFLLILQLYAFNPARAQETVLVTVDTKGPGEVFCSGQIRMNGSPIPICNVVKFPKGSAVTVEAIPPAGQSFQNWESAGGVSVSNPSSNPSTLVAYGGGTLRAVFNGSYTPPDFTIDVTPSSVSTSKGDTAQYTVTITATTPIDAPLDVFITVSGLPANVDRGGATGEQVRPGKTSFSQVLSLVTKDTTIPGTYDVTISAFMKEVSHSKNIQLVVTEKQCPPNCPDLTISGVNWSPEPPGEGQAVTFTYAEINQGNSRAPAHRVTLLIDRQVISNDYVPELAAGESRTRTFAQTWTALPGSHEVMVKVDSNDGVRESDENNNIIVKQIGPPPTEVSTDITISLNPASIAEKTQTLVSMSGRLTRGDTGQGMVSTPVRLEWTGGMTTVVTDSRGYYYYSTQVGPYDKGTYTFAAYYSGTETTSNVFRSSSATAPLSVGSTAMSFDVSMNTPTQYGEAGQNKLYSFVVRQTGGNAEYVTMSVSGLPSNIKYAFSTETGGQTWKYTPTFVMDLYIMPSSATPPGTYSFTLVGTSDSGVTRSAAGTLVIQGGAVDGRVENLNRNPSQINPGETVTISATIRNTGTLYSDYILYTDANGICGYKSEGVSLAPERTGDVRLLCAVPSGTPAGSYGVDVWFTMSAQGGTPKDKKNVGPLMISVAGPLLASLSVTSTNQDSDTVDVSVYIDGAFHQSAKGLEPGKSFAFKALQVQGDVAHSVKITWYDYGERKEYSKETRVYLARGQSVNLPIPIDIHPPTTATIISLNTDAQKYRPGDKVTISYTVKNAGNTDLLVRTVMDVKYPDGSLPYDSHRTGEDQRISLPPGGQSSGTFTWIIPDSAATGSYHVEMGLRDWNNWDTVYDYRWGDKPGPAITVDGSHTGIIRVTVGNQDNSVVQASLYVDGSWKETKNGLAAGASYTFADYSVAGDTNHTVKVTWYDPDTGQVYPKERTIYVKSNQAADVPFDTDFHPPPIDPTLSVNPSSGTPGQSVTITGTGFVRFDFEKNALAIISWDGKDIGSVAIDDDGKFSTDFTIPDSSTGRHTLTVKAIGDSASAMFDVELEDIIPPEIDAWIADDGKNLIIDIEDNEGGSGVDYISLYIDNKKQDQYTGEGKVAVSLEKFGAGKHDYFIIAYDKSGNSQRFPVSGSISYELFITPSKTIIEGEVLYRFYGEEQSDLDGARVTLESKGKSPKITYTKYGYFQFTDIPIDDSMGNKIPYTVKISLMDKDHVIIHRGGMNKVVEITSNEFLLSDEDYQTIEPLTFDDDGSKSAYIFNVAHKTGLFYEELSGKKIPPVDVYTGSFLTGTGFYQQHLKRIEISDNVFVHGWTVDAVEMEYTHYVQDMINDGLPPKHGGDFNHGQLLGFEFGSKNNHCTSDAFMEGLGSFMPAVIHQETYDGTAGTFLNQNLEIDYDTNENRNYPDIEAYVVAGILWDLYDGSRLPDGRLTYDIDDDGAAMTKEQIWNVLSQKYLLPDYYNALGGVYGTSESNRHIFYLYDLYDIFQDVDVNQDGLVDSVDSELVDKIFENHGIIDGYTDIERTEGEDLRV